MGLTNLGATCYVNTFLQMWFLNLELRQALYLCPSTCSKLASGEGIPSDKGGWKAVCCQREPFCSFPPKILFALWQRLLGESMGEATAAPPLSTALFLSPSPAFWEQTIRVIS